MADEYRDPSGNTEAFRAFVRREEPAPAPARSMVPFIVGGAVVVALVLAVVLFIALS